MITKLILPAWEAIKTRGDFSVLWTVMQGKFGFRYSAGTNEDHLKVTMEWLCRAQDATLDSGISAAYDLVSQRWYPSYPETTGYIIPTFFDYAAYSGEETYRNRAVQMADWLLTLQLENGAFPGPPWLFSTSQPVVFDTGQIIHGLVRAFEETCNGQFLDAARRAADWLVEIQEEDGSWIRWDMDHPHTYNARTAWALLRIYQHEQHDRFLLSGMRHLKWVLSQQTPDGWFRNAAFNHNENPLTHTLAYTIEGLLEAGRLLSDQAMIEATCLTANALRDRLVLHGYLKGSYGPTWQSEVAWRCLTGEAQMAVVWLKLYEIRNDIHYFHAAADMNRFLKQVQSRTSKVSGIRGGLAGSYPIYGEYGHYLFLNWAAKFFADSLMLDQQIRATRA